MKKYPIIYFLSIILCGSTFAGQIPTGQDAGSTIREYEDKLEQKKIIKRLVEPKIVPPSLDEKAIEALPGDIDSVYIKRIIIQQELSILEAVEMEELRELTRRYENKSISLEGMETLSLDITQKLVHKRAKAYIPKQSFANGVMFINLVTKK